MNAICGEVYKLSFDRWTDERKKYDDVWEQDSSNNI